jgi:uncharacterized protein YdhG (YjbR/CyaY superfamily)
MKKPETVDEYIASFPPAVKNKLNEIRSVILSAAPGAEEVISYGMPGYKLNGMLVWFGGYEKHIGFYPKPSALKAFKDEISVYKNSKGAVQFPMDKKLPVGLIRKMVKFRLKENINK